MFVWFHFIFGSDRVGGKRFETIQDCEILDEEFHGSEVEPYK